MSVPDFIIVQYSDGRQCALAVGEISSFSAVQDMGKEPGSSHDRTVVNMRSQYRVRVDIPFDDFVGLLQTVSGEVD